MSTLRSIVLCGGSGTRLWPLSRALYPKQFMDLGGHTLFGDTVDRAAALPDSADPLVVCNEEHRFYVAAALQQKGVSGTILLEPKGRNTAPAIALAAFAALSGGGDPLLLVLPSDHVLKPQDVFAEAVARARACAESGRIVTFGITPDAPETGFGYIRRGGALPSGGYAVARFVEKPDLARAEAWRTEGICGTAACSCSAHPSTLKSWPCTLPAFMRRARRRGKGITPIGTLSVPTPTPS